MRYYFKHKFSESYTESSMEDYELYSSSDWIRITEEEYNTLTDLPKTEIDHLSELRSRRTTLLLAFDKWEKAVLRGRETDDASVMQWYQNLLDLVESAFTNIPTRIQYYLGGNE